MPTADAFVVAGAGRRQLRVEQVMGTVISIDVRRPFVEPDALERAFAYLRDIDARFSPYRPDSEVSRLARGEMELAATSLDLRQVLALCEQLRVTTGGHFDASAHRADGMLDPTGVVKGWAAEQAGWMLDADGARNFAISAGGDLFVRGRPDPESRWRIGIQHPRQRGKLAAVLELADGAVATSGTYERGSHIHQPLAGRSADSLLSLTVVGPSLTYADAYATAAFAMGPHDGPAWVAQQPGYGALAITLDDSVIWTPVAHDLRAA